jgi:hypothetical protein
VAGRVRRYDLLAVYSGDQTHVVFRVKARASPDEEIGRVKVSATEPVLVTEMRLLRIPSGARFEAVTLDEAARATVVDRVSVFLRPPQGSCVKSSCSLPPLISQLEMMQAFGVAG